MAQKWPELSEGPRGPDTEKALSPVEAWRKGQWLRRASIP